MTEFPRVWHRPPALESGSGQVRPHPAQAQNLIAYVCQLEATWLDNPLGFLWRYVIDLEKGTVTEKQLDDAGIELPRINERRTGRPYRYLYAAEQPTNTEIRGVVRYDLVGGAKQRYKVPEGDQNSEPIFVPRPAASDEDDGWLIVCVYRRETDTSDLVILDGRNIESDPMATVSLPR
jgi:carotenoid cleavage dioxygenase-like enzyme